MVRKFAKFLVFMGFILAFAVSCAPSSQIAGSNNDSSPPTVAGTVPEEENLVQQSNEGRPGWIDTVSPNTDTHRFFVGLSVSHSTEQDARDAALRDATKQFASFTGVDVSLVDVSESTYRGRSSEIIDPTLAEKSFSTQKTDVFVSRIKPVKWYWEKYKTTVNGKFHGYAYKYWVEVSVPLDEYDRAQKWKEARENIKKTELEQEEARIQAELDAVIKINNDVLQSTKDDLSTGNIIKALSQIQAEGIRLYEIATSFQNRGGNYSSRLNDIKTLKAQTDQLFNLVRTGLHIDTGRFNSYCILPDTSNAKLPAWVFFNDQNKNLPVQGLSLSLIDEKGVAVAVSNTKNDGKAEFFVPKELCGSFRVKIDPHGGGLSGLTDDVTSFLDDVKAEVKLVNSTEDISGAVYSAVTGLFPGPSSEPLRVKKVLLGPVTYEDTRQGTNFGQLLKKQLRYELGNLNALQIVDPKKRTAEDLQSVKTRGIGTVLTEGSKTPSIGSAAMQARIDNADAALETTYSLLGDQVWIDINIREASTDILLASSRGFLPTSKIPAGFELKPSYAQKVVPQSDGGGGSIKLDLTSNFGDGQTYTEGDTITFFVGSDKDAYLLLIYEDAAHNLIQILPNSYSGSGYFKQGDLREIPGRNDKYEMVIEAPFGLERVWGFAATRPFPRLQGRELSNGLIILSGDLANILQQLRNHGKQSDVAYGEAQTLLTTVSKSLQYAAQ